MNMLDAGPAPGKQKLNILFITSELHPFAKVGGLADAAASLAAALAAAGHDVRVVMPRYGMIDPAKTGMKPCLASMGVWMGNTEEWCAVYETEPAGAARYFFIEHRRFFEREGLYHDAAMRDYDDNPRRFAFLCRAALQLCTDTRFSPHIVHVNDWQTALAPAYLKIWHWNDPLLGRAASLLTIHNAAYQGYYPKRHVEYLGIGWDNFTEDKFESYDQINLLKGGIFYADGIVAVSPSFARDICRPHGGFGLAPFLARPGRDVGGILNGIDYALWNPETDPAIPARYSPGDMAGKAACKRRLQETFGLAADGRVPVIGAVGRFVEQKGFHLVTAIIEQLLRNMKAQFVILGNGQRNLEEFFKTLPARFPGTAGSYIGFDDSRAHLINAGSDFFLMPSQWEPCGLNQMYAQRYATLPVVRATGGLDDTVLQYDQATGQGTGFKFNDFTPDALYNTIGWAVSTWYDRPEHIRTLRASAMRQDFSWETSVKKYEEAYGKAIAAKKKYDEQFKSYYW